MKLQNSFKEIKFGETSAAREGALDPELLIDGFFELNQTAQELVAGRKFLFLGYKGSGKSALAEHVRLIAIDNPALFVEYANLDTLSHVDLKRIIGGDIEPESAYPKAWSWLLLIRLISSFAKDDTFSGKKNREFLHCVESLQKAGILPAADFNQVVQISTKKSFKATIQGWFESSLESTLLTTGTVAFFTDRMREIIYKFKTNARHILIIDGIDDIITDRNSQLTSLAGLLTEADRLNLEFIRQDFPAKIVVLCRTDIFERIKSANKNKIKQDSGVVLDWFSNPRNLENTKLVQLANKKASVTFPGINIFREHLNFRVDNSAAIRYLLEHTRHTPRDFLQTLRYIQESTTGNSPSIQEVKLGLVNYSKEYFLPEIKDELVGVLNDAEIEKIVRILGALRRREFTYEELESKASGAQKLEPEILASAVRALFECGAIGNIEIMNDNPIYTYKYRNRQAVVDIKMTLHCHRGMWKALNLA